KGGGEVEGGARGRFRRSIDDRRKDELALLADLKLPTGDHNLRDSNGSLIAPHLQPNSGNPGIGVGLAADRHTSAGGYWLSGMVSAEAATPPYERGPILARHDSMGRAV